MAGIHGIADPALDLHTQHERVQELGAGDGHVFRQRKDCGSDRPRRMDHGLEMRVVEIERVRRHAVEERRMQDVDPLVPSEHARLRGADERGERRQRTVHRLVARRADRAADPVEYRALRFMHDGRRDVLDP